ncbi:hypothetical protein V9T40_002850 [Parthenolecanium corni]|uniref:GPAT/DHAPAT C-terminal domain-containing protein n=1 Tax=Parthenolecanium corni TaxID=536013 RepID=A0AAN9TV80_9HEMI
MPAERSDRPPVPSRNLISGYPVGVSCRYVAETFGDKLREQKLREKQMFFSLLDAEFFKIKRKHCEVNVDIETPFYHGVCDICNPNARILKNEEFREFLDQFLLKCDKDGFKYKRQTVTREMLHSWTTKAAKNMSYSFSSIFFKPIALGWYLISSKFMSKLIVSPVEVNYLKERYRTDDSPFIYVLQSHAKFDWFKVLFVLVFCQLKAPVIFLHRDERPWLRWIYRRCGVTFYNSSSCEKSLKNSVRDEMFYVFVDENLKKKNHLMFYFNSSVESDDRQLLDLVIDSIRRTSVKDVVVVPTSICHEKVERTDLNESFKFSFKELFSRTSSNRGFVKITFSQPYSLMDMIRAVGTKEECQTYDPNVVEYDGHGSGLVTKIYSHIAFDFCKIRALTSTNIVSYLLLTKFRNGVKRDDLVNELDEFRISLRSLDKPVAFTGSSINVINHALKLFNPATVTVDRKPNGLIKPVLKAPYVTEISSYANPVLQFFMLDSLIMRTIYTLRKEQLEDAFENYRRDISFFYEELIRTALELADILQFESPLFKPCRHPDNQIEDFLFKFVCNNYIIKVEKLMTAEEEWSRRVAKHLEDFESDDEDYDEFDDNFEDDDYDNDHVPAPVSTNKGEEYQINYRDDPSVLRNIFLYKNSLNAIIDAYLVSAENLTQLVGKQVTDSTYFRKLKAKMTTMLAEEKLKYPESISLDTLKNSMKLFIAWGVVESHLIDGIQVFYLSNDFSSEDSLLSIVEKIKKFH